MRKVLVACFLVAASATLSQADRVADSDVWFAKLLRSKFGKSVTFDDRDFKLRSLACLPIDITTFQLSPKRTAHAFALNGKLKVKALPKGYSVLNPRKPKYMLILQGYLFSPTGKLVWAQNGYPKGSAWIGESGGTVSFILVDEYSGLTKGYELVVFVAGDPILGEGGETPVLLGAKRITLN